MKHLTLLLGFLCPLFLSAQSERYQTNKAQKLKEASPFQQEIDGKFPERLVYQDELVVALNSIAPQAPVHLLIVPRKRIPTMNDLSPADSAIVARMFWVAKQLAKDKGVAETGYRLAINTNEDAGQSAFHIHLHLLGGFKTGPMVDQRWRNKGPQPGGTYQRALTEVKTIYEQYFAAWLRADSSALLAQMKPTATLMPPGLPPVLGLAAIRDYWFPKDGSRTTVTRFDFELDDLQVDGNLAYLRGHSTLSFTYEKGGQKTTKSNLVHQRLMVLERQEDERWLVVCHVWN